MKTNMKHITNESVNEGHIARSALISFSVYGGLFVAWLAMQLHN